MIVVKLMGGTGNQMFQYAFGKSLSLKNQVELKLDVSALNDRKISGDYTLRNFGLQNFNITTAIASQEEARLYNKSKIGKLIDLLSFFSPFKSKFCYLREPFFSFFGNALKAPSNTYIDGYWQSEKYFNSIRKQLMEDFIPSKSLSPQSVLIADKIKNSESVSIHVRRGDYLSIPENSNLYESCSESYYYEAIKVIFSKFQNATFYVFSDEPEWFKRNIKMDHPVEFVTHNQGENSYEDIILMSYCKHNIIANSSFSWWGAWLNNNTNKMVVAPKKWFKDQSKDTKDLIPHQWLQL